MILKVLGRSGAEFPGCNPPAFLIDGELLLDAGTIGARLGQDEQCAIKNILITHSHLDHLSGIPSLADNIALTNGRHSVTLFAIAETVAALREDLFNDRIWPDFTKIPDADNPVVRLVEIAAGKRFKVEGYTVEACAVNHTVPAVGYVVRDREGKVLLYTGDTTSTDDIWLTTGKTDALIVEVSLPNRLESLAKTTGHLTPLLLRDELSKIPSPPERILITHPKPQYIGQIIKEIRQIGVGRIEMLKEGKTYEI